MNRNYVYIAAALLVLNACGSSSEDTEVKPPVEPPVEPPTGVSPTLFSTGQPFALDLPNRASANSTIMFDVNNDSLQDMVSIGHGTLIVRENLGDNLFEESQLTQIDQGELKPLLGELPIMNGSLVTFAPSIKPFDLNGDGFKDLVITTSQWIGAIYNDNGDLSGTVEELSHSSWLDVLEQQQGELHDSYFDEVIDIADYDGDGYVDLIWTNRVKQWNDSYVVRRTNNLLLSRGSADGFKSPEFIDSATVYITSSRFIQFKNTIIAGEKGLFYTTKTDYFGDELFKAEITPDSVSVDSFGRDHPQVFDYYGDGVGSAPGIYMVDLNDDDKVEIIVATKDGNDTLFDSELNVLMTLAPDFSQESSEWFDINGDGWLDLLDKVYGYEAGEYDVYLYQEEGLQAQGKKDFGNKPLWLSEYNDGHAGLVSYDAKLEKFIVHDAISNESSVIATSASPKAINLNDFDNDGYEDITMSLSNGDIAFAGGNEDGTFEPVALLSNIYTDVIDFPSAAVRIFNNQATFKDSALIASVKAGKSRLDNQEHYLTQYQYGDRQLLTLTTQFEGINSLEPINFAENIEFLADDAEQNRVQLIDSAGIEIKVVSSLEGQLVLISDVNVDGLKDIVVENNEQLHIYLARNTSVGGALEADISVENFISDTTFLSELYPNSSARVLQTISMNWSDTAVDALLRVYVRDDAEYKHHVVRVSKSDNGITYKEVAKFKGFQQLSFVDLDGDSIQDLVLGACAKEPLYLLGNEDGEMDISSDCHPNREIVISDVDFDGKLDLIDTTIPMMVYYQE
ncbi:VCBS repeat-containing protein [Pseudoalteromonas sp. YIC-656]|uniref:FG-GAP repeat domain-containing protein n=1 Tax=Pseudoalteromonas pernae TaxID=3118054 RepID=UPI003242FA75